MSHTNPRIIEMLSYRLCGPATALLLALISNPASAHVTLEVSEERAGATFKAVMRVPHGCEGQATETLRIAIPEGFTGVKPMPKAGWQLRTVLDGAGAVREVVWSGGNLPDAHYDEFVLRGQISREIAAPATLSFKAFQECASAKVAWDQVPAKGQPASELKYPAPTLRIIPAVAAASALAVPVFKAGALTIEQPWVRATPPGARVGGGYLRVTNSGGQPDRLIGGSLVAAGAVEVHEMVQDGGMMRMRELEKGLDIPANGSIELKPGGLHLMFMGLKRPLSVGESLEGTLVFERAGTVKVQFGVQPIGAAAPSSPGGAAVADPHAHH